MIDDGPTGEGDKRLRLVLAAVRMGLWEWVPATDALSWSCECQRILDTAAMQDTFEGFLRCVHLEDRPLVTSATARSVNLGQPYRAEFRVQRRSGAIQWLEQHGQVELDDRGDVRRILGTVRDSTSDKQMAEQLRASQLRLRETGGVAHDFNNLLTVICGHCDLLQATAGPDCPASHHESIAAIRGAGERAARLTRQLLSVSRHAFRNVEAFDINGLLEKSLDFIKSLVGEAIETRLELDPNLHVVKIDPCQFEQAILNLVLNARDAMPQGGRLTIATSNVSGSQIAENLPLEMHDSRYVQVEVSDTGVGMTSEVRSRIFEPFFTTKGSGRGTGLGLPVVHGAVQQTGGYIDVASEPGKGTTFRLVYPSEPRPVDMSGSRSSVAQLPLTPKKRSLTIPVHRHRGSSDEHRA